MPRNGKTALTMSDETFEMLKNKKEVFDGTWDDFFHQYITPRFQEDKQEGSQDIEYIKTRDNGDEVYFHPRKKEFVNLPSDEVDRRE